MGGGGGGVGLSDVVYKKIILLFLFHYFSLGVFPGLFLSSSVDVTCIKTTLKTTDAAVTSTGL